MEARGPMSERRIEQAGEEIEAPEIRDMLRACELGVANLRGLGAEALDLLRRLDRISVALDVLRDRGMDVRPEEARLESIQDMLTAKTKVLLKELRAVGGLARARAEENPLPPEDHWWWYLDLTQKKRQWMQLRRMLIFAGIGVALLTIGAVAYNKLVPRNAVLEAKLNHVGSAESYLAQGDVDAALREYEAARSLDPSDPDVLVWLGVLYESQGRAQDAQSAFEQAESLAGSRAEFLVLRGMAYGQLGDADRALADGQEAVRLDPNLARAHLVLAGAYEAKGNINAAMDELEATANLAHEQGNDSLYVIAKTREGMLLQRGLGGALSPQPTAEK